QAEYSWISDPSCLHSFDRLAAAPIKTAGILRIVLPPCRGGWLTLRQDTRRPSSWAPPRALALRPGRARRRRSAISLEQPQPQGFDVTLLAWRRPRPQRRWASSKTSSRPVPART